MAWVGDHNLSTVPFGPFLSVLGSADLGEAILDRIVSKRHIKIELKGES